MIPMIDPKPKLPRTKVRVDAQQLPMLATICPAQIVGSEKSEGYVTLILEGKGLPDAEFSTLFCTNDGVTSTVKIEAQN